MPAISFKRFRSLRCADDADQRREDAHRRTARLLEVVAFAEQAVVAGARRIARIEYRELPVEANRRAGDQRLARGDAGAVDRMPRREVVGAVENDVGGAASGPSSPSPTRSANGAQRHVRD